MRKLIKIESMIEELDDTGLCESSERQDNTYDADVCDLGHYITIAYTDEQECGTTETEITVIEDAVRVMRRGAVESVFNFKEGLTESSLYKSAGYAFDAEIYTRKIRNNLTRVEGSLTIFYDMTVGGAKKRVRMKIITGEVCE